MAIDGGRWQPPLSVRGPGSQSSLLYLIVLYLPTFSEI